MRFAVLLCTFALACPVRSADSESRTPYQLRVVVRTADHPTLTAHFRTEVRKSLAGALEAALGPVGAVEVIDLNATPPDKRDVLLTLADERGLEAIDTAPATGGPKTHFVFVDFADGKYEIRTRQHDGSTGFVTPIVRRTVHPDRGFVGRLAGLAVAQDFGAVGTLEAPDVGAANVSLQLRAGELGPMEPWVKKGEVFAVVHLKQSGRAAAKADKGKKEVAVPAITGTRLDGVLLQVIDGPRDGVCTCKLYNRFKGGLPRDAFTLGYRAVKLGTAEGPLKLRLVDAAGVPFRGDVLQPRAGVQDYPDAARDREEMAFADGVFTSKETFKHLAFVTVRAGDALVARIPVEIFEGQVATRRVDPKQTQVPAAQAVATEMMERVRTARVMQARCFDEIGTLQAKDKPKALEYGEAAYESLDKEADALRTDLSRLRDRHKTDAPTALFDASEADLRTLEAKTKELRAHLGKLRDAIKQDNDPAVVAARKAFEGLILEADLLAEKADYEAAIAKYEEAIKVAATDPAAREKIEKRLEGVRKLWVPANDAEHGEARKFVFDVWAKLDSAAGVKENLPAARKAFEKCKAVGDRGTLLKMHTTAPGVSQRYEESLKALIAEAGDDPDKKSELQAYLKVTEDLDKLLAELGQTVGAGAPK
jgi:tetratricopeptide (TPR) repeat protein